MIDVTEYHKELLTRLSFGKELNTINLVLPESVNTVIGKIISLQNDLDRADVHAAVKGMYQNMIFSACSTLEDNELLAIIRNDNSKYKVQVIQSKMSKAILENINNPTFDWNTLLTEANMLLSTQESARSVKFIHELNFEDADVVGTFGYELLDFLISGGLTKGSYTIFYGGVNIGKSTLAVAPVALGAIKAGKKPMIISLEGNEMGTIIKLVAQSIGLCGIDSRHMTAEQKNLIKKAAETFPEVPVVPCNASKRYELDRLIRIYKPDVIIYDQLTLGSDSRDWQDMAKISQTLQRLALETGIPVVALTQSDKKFGALPGVGEESPEDIKYSAAIRQDATTVIKIGHVYPERSNERILTIEKTKDDSLSGLLPVKVKVSWNRDGVKDLGVLIQGKYTSKEDYIMLNKRTVAPIKVEEHLPQVKEVLKKEGVILPTSVDDIKTEVGVFKAPNTDIAGEYNTERYLTTHARMAQVGEALGIKELVKISKVLEKNPQKVNHDGLFTSSFLADYTKHAPFISGYYYRGGVADDDTEEDCG